MREPKTRTIYNNYDLCDKFDYIKNNQNEVFNDEEEHSEEAIWEKVYFEDDIDWNDEKERMEDFFNNPYGYIITGSIGRWNGKYDGGKVFKDWEDLWDRPNPFEDCDYLHFYDKNGHFYIDCSHHDGDCNYEIKELTEKGYEYYDRWNYGNDYRSEREIHNKIMNNSHYAKLPRFAEKIYGCPAREYERR